MYVGLDIGTYARREMCEHVCMQVYMCACTHVCMNACMHVDMYLCTQAVSVLIRMRVCLSPYIHVYTCSYVCMDERNKNTCTFLLR